MTESTEARIRAVIFPAMVAIVLGLFTVAGGLVLYIWNESQQRSEEYRAQLTVRIDQMQDTLVSVGKAVAVLTAIQERQEKEDQARP